MGSEIGCSVCGYGRMMDSAKSEEIFNFPDQPALPCGLLQSVGLSGSVPLSQCPQLAELLSGDTQTEYGFDCGCMPCSCDDNNCGPAPTPTASPTVSPPDCPIVPATGCSVCGIGKMMDPAKSDVVFNFPDQPAIPCGLLQTVGLSGSVPLESCPALAEILSGDTQTEFGFDCGCMPCTAPPTAPTPAPIPRTPQPTFKQVPPQNPDFPPAMDQNTSAAETATSAAATLMMAVS